MIIAGFVFAGIAALIHIFIFYLESLAWTGTRARATFGTTKEQASDPSAKALAFNQGFYNLFLAVTVIVGIVLAVCGQQAVGAALVFSSTGSMAAAALVLLLSSRDKARAALKQGIVPTLAVVALAIGLLL